MDHEQSDVVVVRAVISHGCRNGRTASLRIARGDVAEASSDLTMFDRVGDRPITVRLGRYTDSLARQPDAGRIFRIDGLGASGPACAPYRGQIPPA